MALSPYTNADLPAIAATLGEGTHFAICGHVNPDGDCLGSMLALGGALRGLGKQVDCLLVRMPRPRRAFTSARLRDPQYAGSRLYGKGPYVHHGGCASLDDRIGACAPIRAAAPRTITLDHHEVTCGSSQLNYVDPDAPATCLIVWDLLKLLPAAAITPDVALCAYTGLMTDTGRFQFQNTSAAAFHAAAEMVEAGVSPDVPAREVFQSRSVASMQLEGRLLERMELLCNGRFSFSYITRSDFAEFGAVKADAEPLIDTLRAMRGVQIACILKVQPDGVVRGSLRSEDRCRRGGRGMRPGRRRAIRRRLDSAQRHAGAGHCRWSSSRWLISAWTWPSWVHRGRA